MIYICIVVSLIFCIVKYDIYSSSQYKNTVFKVVFFVLWFLAAFRYRIGNDTADYMYEYTHSLAISDCSWEDILGNINRRPGWNILIGVCKQIGSDYVIFQLFHSTFINYSIYHFIKRYSKMIYVSAFIYFVLFYVNLCFDAMREALAVAVFLWSINSFTKNKWVKYYFIACIASLFHISSIIIFILPLVKILKPTKTLLICSFVIFCVLLSLYPFINEYLLYLQIWGNVGDFGSKATNYLSNENYQFSGTILSIIKALISGVLVSLFFVYYYCMRRNDSYDWIIQINLVYILLNILNVGAPLFYRFQSYLCIIYVILISNCCYYLLYEKKLCLLTRQFSIFVVLICISYYPIKRYFMPFPPKPEILNYRLYSPYSTVFFKDVDMVRESMRDHPEIK